MDFDDLWQVKHTAQHNGTAAYVLFREILKW